VRTPGQALIQRASFYQRNYVLRNACRNEFPPLELIPARAMGNGIKHCSNTRVLLRKLPANAGSVTEPIVPNARNRCGRLSPKPRGRLRRQSRSRSRRGRGRRVRGRVVKVEGASDGGSRPRRRPPGAGKRRRRYPAAPSVGQLIWIPEAR